MKSTFLLFVAFILTACSTAPLPPEIDKNAPKIPISPMYQK
jgi:starvation-inducible outer membrane lipoprotein